MDRFNLRNMEAKRVPFQETGYNYNAARICIVSQVVSKLYGFYFNLMNDLLIFQIGCLYLYMYTLLLFSFTFLHNYNVRTYFCNIFMLLCIFHVCINTPNFLKRFFHLRILFCGG